MSAADTWQARQRTLAALALLCAARLLVALVPLKLWRGSVGGRPDCAAVTDLNVAKRLAAHVERASWRLPVAIKCLPRAIALSWQLRRRGLCHSVVFAVRPPLQRDQDDTLHAWVECGGAVIIGELPGPWITVHRQGSA